MQLKRGWLKRQIEKAHNTVQYWPEWKRNQLMTTESDKAKMIYAEGVITGRAQVNADVTDMVKRVAARCAEIAETHASIAETNMWGCPHGSDKMKEWELAMIEAEHIAKDIRKEFYLSD